MVKRYLILVLAIAMLMTFSAGYLSASHLSSNEDLMKGEIAAHVRDWVLGQYSEHYHLSDYSGDVVELEVVSNEFRALVPVVVYTTLKYDSAESVPYVQGIKSALNISSMEDVIRPPSGDLSQLSDSALLKANPFLDPEVAEILTVMLSELYSDIEECIGAATGLSLDFVAIGKIESSGRVDSVSLFVDDMNRLINADLYVPKSKDALRADGEADEFRFAKGATERAAQQTSQSTNGYDDYNRRPRRTSFYCSDLPLVTTPIR